MELNHRPFTYVDCPDELRRCVTRLRDSDSVAVDTEANSLYAYRERLCLIQCSSDVEDFLIDPIVIQDLTPMAELLQDVDVEKVFHDGEYDLLQLKATLHCEVRHIYDTKIAAVALGNQGCGLAGLLSTRFGVTLDKRWQLSDWGARPLSREQMDYARKDTAFLLALAEQLEEEVDRRGGIIPVEVLSECRRLESVEPSPRTFDPDDFARLPGAGRLGPRERRILRELFVMRDQQAAARDVPPFKILSNATLMALARAQPRHPHELGQVRELPGALAGRHGDAILAAVARGHSLEPIHRMPAPGSDSGTANRLQRAAQRAAFDRLRQWRKAEAERRPTDPSHILARELLYEIASSMPGSLAELGQVPDLEPWRAKAYGPAILEAVHGHDRGHARRSLHRA
jgi:ribonuclease D